MTVKTFCSRVMFVGFAAATAASFAALCLEVSAEEATTSENSQSSQEISPHANPAGQPRKGKPAVENRVNPKHRSGKLGSDEAKLDADQARELYIRRKHRLEEIQAQQQELSKDKRLLATNRARMQARLIETARALRHSEKRLGEIEETLSQTRTKVQEQRAKLEDKSAQMSALFSLMQGMSRQPPPVIITHSRDALKMIRSGMVLATFYGDIEKLAAQISTELTQLEATQKEAESQERRRKAEQAQASKLKAQIDLLLIENREQLESTEADLEGLKSVAKIQAANIKSLEEMLPALDEQVAKKSGLGNYEAELKNGTQEVTPDGTKVALLQPGRMKPSIPFAKSQGLLPLPVQGKIVVKFAQTDQYGVASKGTHIEARGGAQVISPCDGWIIYAGPFHSYGQLLIINPGGGYHVVIAGMDRVQATVGQFVLAGEPIAVMGSVETRAGDKTLVRPTLYVEFRRDKQSIDPAPWWSAGVGKG